MEATATGGFLRFFGDLPDPRTGNVIHKLHDLLVIAILAVVCGADSWAQVELFGRSKRKWLGTFLELPGGIPSHDTFGRVFSLLDPDAFERCFLAWMSALVEAAGGRLLAVDGKSIRNSFEHAWDKSGMAHLVSAFVSQGDNRLVLGQLAVADKANEIVAIPKLLALLDLSGAVVSIDAIGCQREVARTITDAGGAYVLALKGNQPELYQAVTELFADPAPGGIAAETVTHDCTVDGGHGRVERRECWAATDPALIAYLDPAGRWPGLQSVVMVQSRRIIGEMTQSETRYYLSSLPADAQRLNALVRTHWRIENQLHWVLDVVFAEDQSRIRSGYADQNFAALRRFVVSLLTQDTSRKLGQHAKRLRAGWDNDYLLQLLTQ
jgi:predicted transposase YbfD/YdcC